MSDMNTAAGAGARPADTADARSKAKQMASDAAQTAKAEAAQFAEKAKDQARRQIETKKNDAANLLADVAEVIHQAASDLEGRDRTGAAGLGHKAASGLDRLADTIGTQRPEELLGQARDLARRNPVPVAAGSLLLGFAIGRFLRSSNKPDPDELETSPSGAGFERDGQLGLEV